MAYDSNGVFSLTYTWATDRAWAGTCRQLTFVFADGTSRSLLFRFS